MTSPRVLVNINIQKGFIAGSARLASNQTDILILNDYELKNMLSVVNMEFDYLINNI